MADNLLTNLLAMDVDPMELLSAGEHRDTGVLAKLSRHQLVKLVPEAESHPGMDFDTILSIARFNVERALCVKNGATKAELAAFDEKSAPYVKRRVTNHLTKQAASAQRRATQPMTDATETTVTEKTPKHAAKKSAKKAAKAPARKVAAKKAPAKKATGEAATASTRGVNDPRKLKLLVKENPKRITSESYARFELYRGVKTVGQYIEAGGRMADITYDVNHEFIEVS